VVLERDEVEPRLLGQDGEADDAVRGVGRRRQEDAELEVVPVVGPDPMLPDT
jgi:hypothetical protein